MIYSGFFYVVLFPKIIKMINFNNTLIAATTNLLSINNRAFKYGDGLFETLKVMDLKVCFLEDHYFRLMASMRMLRFEIPLNFTMEFFEQEIARTVEANNLQNARIRFSVYRKDGGLYNPLTNEVDYVIEASELNIAEKEVYTLELFKDYYIYSGLLSTLKTTNKLINVLASIYANENELDNCILVNEKKNVVEAINGNVFLVVGNTIKTPALTEGCIKGIIRKKVIEILENHKNYTIEETAISPFELQKADELFITNAIVGIQAVSSYKKTNYASEVSTEIKTLLTQLI